MTSEAFSATAPTVILPSRERRQRLITGSKTITLFYNSDGTLNDDLSLVHQVLTHAVSSATAELYCRDFQAFKTYLEGLGQNWLAPPPVVRRAAADYLRGTGAYVKPRGDDWIVHTAPQKTSGRQSHRLVLESLRAVYRTARRVGLYVHPEDPFIRLRIRARQPRPPRPPARSGLTSPPAVRADRAHYFVFEGGDWLPHHLLDPEFCERILTVFEAPGGKLRDLIITRLLFETGARVSEICALTLDGWRQTIAKHPAYGQVFKVANKGQGDQPRKQVTCSATTADLMHVYFANERQALDPLQKKFEIWSSSTSITPEKYAAFSHASGVQASLFLNDRGRPYTANAWRKGTWRPKLAAAGLSARPHQIRHWFVSTRLRAIADMYSNDPLAYQQHRQALGQYMHWASPERMLATYDQGLSDVRVIELVADVTTHLQSLSHQQLSDLMGIRTAPSSPRAQCVARLNRGDLT